MKRVAVRQTVSAHAQALLSVVGRVIVSEGPVFPLVSFLLAVVCCGWPPLVTDEWAAYRSAEREYDECVAEHSGEPSVCDPLRAARDERYERYEREAKDEWGCEYTVEGCYDDPNGDPASGPRGP